MTAIAPLPPSRLRAGQDPAALAFADSRGYREFAAAQPQGFCNPPQPRALQALDLLDERAVRASHHAAGGTASQWSSLQGAQERLDVSVDPPRGSGDRR